MAIIAGQAIEAADFVSTPGGAGDSGKVVKLDNSGKIPTGFLRFGGDGLDGALVVTTDESGSPIDLGGVQVYVKNYTSISITGTGKIAFINPHANGTIIILKSQGNVTLTSSATPMINASGMGATASGETGSSLVLATNSAAGVPSAGGALAPTFINTLYGKQINLFAGSAGSNGGQGGGTAAVGGHGDGGGGLYIECAGALNFTTASGISVAGKAGTNGAGNTVDTSGGGGGGGGGRCVIIANTIIASTGTITITGGAGGNGGIGGDISTSAAAGGGGGGSYFAGGSGGNAGSGSGTGSGGGGGAGGTTGAGSVGSAGVNAASGGGGGGSAGSSLVALNTEFS